MGHGSESRPGIHSAQGLAEDPQERYGTIEQFAEDLEAYLESRPVAARSGNLWYYTRKFGRRHWLALAAGALVIAGLTAGLVVANRARRLAELRFSAVARPVVAGAGVRQKAGSPAGNHQRPP